MANGNSIQTTLFNEGGLVTSGRKALYRGFSSYEYQNTGSFKITDLELVKLDLLNHIFTRRGERVNEPTFGTSIPDMPFEPITEELLDELRDELETVFDYDPRVELLQLDLVTDVDGNSITAQVALLFVEFQVTDVLNIRIDLEGTQ